MLGHPARGPGAGGATAAGGPAESNPRVASRQARIRQMFGTLIRGPQTLLSRVDPGRAGRHLQLGPGRQPVRLSLLRREFARDQEWQLDR